MKKRFSSLCPDRRPILFALFSALLIFGLIGLILPGIARSASVSLGWDANTESNLAGYKLYYGTASRTYSNNLTVGNYTSCTISGLTEGRTYYFALKAYNTSGLESPYSGEVSCTISAAAAAFAVNAGGPQYASASGPVFMADTGFRGGYAHSTSAGISGTSDATLYRSQRTGNFSYNIALANGSYKLTLKFAEIWFKAPRRRVFNVLVNGKTVVSRLDIYARAGANKAFDVVIPVSVTNGSLRLQFRPVVDNAVVNAIAVTK